MFTHTQMNVTAKWFARNEGKLNFNHVIQRNKVWTHSQKSKLIHSAMVGYPVPDFYVVELNDDILWFLDGKQRGTSFIEFIKGGFELSKDTPPVEIADGEWLEVAGKNFLELPENLRDEIKDCGLKIHKYKNMKEHEISELFLRLNGGTPLTKIQITRVIAGTTFMEFVRAVAEQKFFRELIVISDNARNKSVDEDLILQTMSLVCSGDKFTSFSGDDVRKFAEQNKEGVSEEMQEVIFHTTLYLEEAISEKHKKLIKVNVPILFNVAITAQKDNVPAKAFGEWLFNFLDNYAPGGEYGSHCSTKTATKENVLGRLKAMTKDYNNLIGKFVAKTQQAAK